MGSLQAHSGLSNLSFKTKKAKIHSNILGLKQLSLSGVTFINGKNASLERARKSQRPVPIFDPPQPLGVPRLFGYETDFIPRALEI